MPAVLDTHAVIWYLLESRKLPERLQVALALQRILKSVVPEMPDRIIAATALHLGLPLVTRDHRLRSAGIETIW